MASFVNRFYKTFSGTDTIAFALLPDCVPVALGSVTTISYSMFRAKRPVINIGRTNVNGITRGSRMYGGTMVFTVIDQHWLANLAEQIGWIGNYSDLKCDELPLFDLMITSANEYGSYVSMYISGIDFTDEQQTMSVEDMFTENVFQFIARDIYTYKDGNMSNARERETYLKNSNYGFYITDSSTATNEDLSKAYDDKVKSKNNFNNKESIQPLTRNLYLSDPSLMSGGDVGLVQQMLKKLGYIIGNNYLYDETTKNAVKKFQSEHGITPNGVVDNETYVALVNAYNLKSNMSGTGVIGTIVNKNGAYVYEYPTVNSNIVDTLSYQTIIELDDAEVYSL